MVSVTIRIDLSEEDAVGPGKIRLLEHIRETGSISAAGRAMDMSYRRAWMLIDVLNTSFRRKVVSTTLGGKEGGGAKLTAFGQELLKRYRAIENDAEIELAVDGRGLLDEKPLHLLPLRGRSGA